MYVSFPPGYQWYKKNDVHFYEVDFRVAVDGLRVSSYFNILAIAFLQLSLALASSFDTCTVRLIYTFYFIFLP